MKPRALHMGGLSALPPSYTSSPNFILLDYVHYVYIIKSYFKELYS
jgi:hypothetical protein